MNFFRICILGLVVFFSLQSFDCEAQLSKRLARKLSRYRRGAGFGKSKPVDYFTLAFGVGYNNYFGDLSPAEGLSTNFNSLNPYFGAQVLYRFNPNFQLRAGLSYVKISATDADVNPSTSANLRSRYIRNLHFRNQIVEASAMLEANLFPISRGYLKREYFDPYIFAGITVFSNNPQAKGAEGTDVAGQWIDLRPLRTENNGEAGFSQAYSTVQIGIPIGAGIRMRLTNQLDLGFEIGYRINFSNFLDDVGSTYLLPFFGADTSISNRKLKEEASKFDPLQLRMSNRSAEEKDSYGNLRMIGDKTIAQLKEEGTQLRHTTLSDGSDFWFFKSLEKGQSPRGGAAPDLYIVSAFHLYYILPKNSIINRRRR